jgi:hypothetical protein
MQAQAAESRRLVPLPERVMARSEDFGPNLNPVW